MECVASLQAQTYSHWQAVIVNDGSPDATHEIATALASADRRVEVVYQPNGGLSSARNFGLQHVKGDYVQFLDADDLLLPRKFEAHLKVADVSTANTVTYTDYFHGDYENPTTRVEGGRLSCRLTMPRPLLDFAARWEHKFSIPIHATLFPTGLLQQIAPVFDVALPNHEDWDMWMRVASKPVDFRFIPEVMAVYRFGMNSMSRDSATMWSGFNQAIKKQLDLLKLDPESVQCLQYLSHKNDHRFGKGLAKWVHKAVSLKALYALAPELRNRISG